MSPCNTADKCKNLTRNRTSIFYSVNQLLVLACVLSLSEDQSDTIAGCDLTHVAVTAEDAMAVVKSVTDVDTVDVCDVVCGSCFWVCFDLSSRRTCCSSDISASSFSAARFAISWRFIFFFRAFVSFSM